MNDVSPLMVAEGVSIYFNGQDEIRIRKGIWNYEEAILALGEADRHLRQALVGVFELLSRGEILDMDRFIHQENHAPEVAAQIRQIIDALRAQHYLQAEDDHEANLLLYDMLGGTVANRYVYGVQPLRPILFIGDTAAIKDHAARLAGEIGLPLSVMTEADFASITRFDLTTRYDGYTTHEQLDYVTKLIAPYAAIVGCIERPHIAFLRNLNRALIQTSIPLSLALIDGPFTSLFTIKPPETGCFECFELRLMARMQDIAAYRQYVDHTRGRGMGETPKTFLTPLMCSLAAQALFEGFLIASIGKAKLAGRLLNTYLPIMEIQVQDLLRIPFCPACGFISKAQRDEMYTSTKKIVDRVMEHVVIT
jgi:thiazole/oxazole-forming peptide maturase SagC family component